MNTSLILLFERILSADSKALERSGFLRLNHFPLPKIIERCSSRDVQVQETAFMHLLNNLQSQYLDYKPENFRDVEFIPAESKDYACLKKLGEVR